MNMKKGSAFSFVIIIIVIIATAVKYNVRRGKKLGRIGMYALVPSLNTTVIVPDFLLNRRV